MLTTILVVGVTGWYLLSAKKSPLLGFNEPDTILWSACIQQGHNKPISADNRVDKSRGKFISGGPAPINNTTDRHERYKFLNVIRSRFRIDQSLVNVNSDLLHSRLSRVITDPKSDICVFATRSGLLSLSLRKSRQYRPRLHVYGRRLANVLDGKYHLHPPLVIDSVLKQGAIAGDGVNDYPRALVISRSLDTGIQRRFALSLTGSEGISVLRKSSFEFAKALAHRFFESFVVGINSFLNGRIGRSGQPLHLRGRIRGSPLHDAHLTRSRESVEDSSKRYENARPYQRFVVNGSLLPSLAYRHITEALLLVMGLVSSFFLTITVIFWEGSSAGMLARMGLYGSCLIISVALFFALLTLDSQPVETLPSRPSLSHRVPLSRPSGVAA
jgi:hypothetical protein